MRSIRVVFSVYRGKSGFHKTGKGFIDEVNTLHLLMGFDVVKQEPNWLEVFDYNKFLFPLNDTKDEYKGWYTEYVDDFEIEREDRSFDTRDVEIDYLIWFKKIDKENANV